MSRDRRVLVCIVIGATLAVAAIAVNELLRTESPGGWFVYQPEGEPMFSPASSDREKLSEAAVWLAAIALWFATSWRLFRPRPD